MSELTTRKISTLDTGAEKPVYRRKSGEFFIKLNHTHHVKVLLKGGSWIGDGTTEEINQDEEVEVLQFGKGSP